MAITNWAQVGAAAHQGDMDRAQLALASRRQSQSEQAQRFNQERAMALDADARTASDRAYRDQREDLAYNRQQAERAYNDQRADLAYNRQRNAEQEVYNRWRQERVDELALDRERRLNEASQFDRMLKEEEAERRRTLWERDNAEYEKIQQQEQERKEALESSFASLVTAGFKYGDEVKPGMYCVPTPYIQKFNELTGQQLGGLVIATRDGAGKALSTPQLMALEPIFDQQGKQVLGGADGKTPQVRLTPMPEAFTRGMFAAYPGVADAAGRFPESDAWMQAMGIVPRGVISGTQADDKFAAGRMKQINTNLRGAQEHLNTLLGATIPDKTAIANAERDVAHWQGLANAEYGLEGRSDEVDEEKEAKPKFVFSPALQAH